METKSGQVINVTYKDVAPPGKRPFKVHSVVLSSGEEIEVGYKQPYKIGQQFNSEVEFKYGKYKEVKPLVPGATPTPGPAAAAVGASSGPMNFPIPKSNKETAIIRQNALTNAANVHAALIKVGAYTAGPNLAEDVIALAYQFAEFSSGQREMRLAKDLVDGND